MKKINKEIKLKKQKNDRAITLIALVVTIIILLILAGVAIGFAMNGTGLFDKAKLATDEYNNKVAEENFELGQTENLIDIQSNRDTVTLTQEQFKGLFSTPGNKLKDMPNTWEVGTEYCWEADGQKIYGKRYTGSFSPTTATRNEISIDTSTEAREVINYGGRIGDYVLPFSNIYISSNQLDCAAFLLSDGKSFFYKSSSAPGNPTYDVWVLYKKTS